MRSIASTPPRVAYVLKRYPRYSETFIVNEILAHEAAGQPLEIFALRPVAESHFQDILGRVQAPVLRFPEKVRNADALWRLLCEARATLPGAWSALGEGREMGCHDVAQALLVARACQERGIAHLHAHFGTVSTTVARLAARFSGISYSFTAHAKDIFFNYEEELHLDLKLRDAARVVTVSDYNVAYLRERFGPLAAGVTRLYNGLDLRRFAYCTPRREATGILAVGRLIEKKGFDILIEAVRLLRAEGRAVSCRIVGAGDEAGHLATQVAASGVGNAVELTGPRPQHRPPLRRARRRLPAGRAWRERCQDRAPGRRRPRGPSRG